MGGKLSLLNTSIRSDNYFLLTTHNSVGSVLPQTGHLVEVTQVVGREEPHVPLLGLWRWLRSKCSLCASVTAGARH